VRLVAFLDEEIDGLVEGEGSGVSLDGVNGRASRRNSS
jgi:hypothetical protein